ncbi:MAG: hypothetical protein ABF243_07910 [Celeribacter marinus]
MVDCIASGRTPETSGADNFQTLALVEAPYLSAAEEWTVSLRAL